MTLTIRSILTISILVVIFFSCNGTSNNSKGFELRPTGEVLILPIDAKTSNISTGLVTYEDYLINVNWNTNSLQFYSLSSQKLEKEIFYQYEGPQGIGSLFGIHVQSLDSIFLFPQLVNLITLTDTSGQILNRIPYDIPERSTNAFVHNAYFGSPPLLKDKRLFVKTHIEGNSRAMTEDVLVKSRMGYGINLLDSSTQSINLTYPEGYLSNGLKHFEPSLIFQKDFTVYSLFGDHRVFKHYSDGTLEAFEGKSQFLDESLPLFPVDGERFDTYKYLSASSRYEELIYDSYRELYYRFAYPTLPIQSEEELRLIRENPGPFVIQVFDSNLKLLTERLFEGETYFPNNSFITKAGLYISINNPANPEASEDLSQFERIDLVEENS